MVKTKDGIGNQFYIKNSFSSNWRAAEESELQSLLQKNNVPINTGMKLQLPLFGYERTAGSNSNQQLYPTQSVVLEIDAPAEIKDRIKEKDPIAFDEFSKRIEELFAKWRDDSSVHYHIMYVTPSQCGIRFILKTDTAVENEAEYKKVVRQFLEGLRADGVDEKFYDERVNQAWFLPIYEDYFHIKGAIFPCGEIKSPAPAVPTVAPFLSPLSVAPAELDRPEDILKIEAIIAEGKSITFDYDHWYKTAFGLANTFSYEKGKELFLDLCRLDGAKHSETESIAKWDQCYASKKTNGIGIGTVIKFAQEEKFRSYLTATAETKVTPGLLSPENEMTVISLKTALERVRSFPETPRVWRGIVKPSVNFAFGMAKSYKSIFSECLALSIASGRKEFLGDKINIDNPTALIINLEEYFVNRTLRNDKQFQEFSEEEKRLAEERYFVVDERSPSYLVDERGWNSLSNLFEKHRPGFVVIDSLSHINLGAIEKSSVAQEVVAKLRDLAQRFDVAMLVVHHSVKMDNRSLRMSDMSGSRILGQDADGIIGLNRTQNRTTYTCDIVYRYAPASETCKILELTPTLWLKAVGEATEDELFSEGFTDGRKDDRNGELILAYLKKNGECSKDDLNKVFVGTHVMTNPTLHSWLNTYLESGIIARPRKARYTFIGAGKAHSVIAGNVQPEITTGDANPTHAADDLSSVAEFGIEGTTQNIPEVPASVAVKRKSRLEELKEEEA